MFSGRLVYQLSAVHQFGHCPAFLASLHVLQGSQTDSPFVVCAWGSTFNVTMFVEICITIPEGNRILLVSPLYKQRIHMKGKQL